MDKDNKKDGDKKGADKDKDKKDKDKDKRKSGILASFRPKDRKEKYKPGATRTKSKLGEVDEHDLEHFHEPESPVDLTKMSDAEISKMFEQMLDDMNLTEDKKTPLRKKNIQEKIKMLSMQQTIHVGARKQRGKYDSALEFVAALNNSELRGDKSYELLTSLRVALTSNPVSWVKEFATSNGLNGLLNSLNYNHQTDKRSTLECIRCLRAFTNNMYGLMQVIGHEEAVRVLTSFIDSRDPASMLEAIKLLAALCFIPPNGHEKVLEGISMHAEIRKVGEKSPKSDRFSQIIVGVQSPDVPMKTGCIQLINAIISQADDIDFRLHLRNEFLRCGFLDALTVLSKEEAETSEDLRTQIRVFNELKEEDNEELSHRYDNIRIVMDDPKQCFDILASSTRNTASESYFLSILQHLMIIRDDDEVRPLYYKLIEECVTQIVLHKNGIDPDFRETKRFDIDVEPLLGKLSEEEGSQGGARESSTAHRHFKSKLEEALTAKQESEAKMASMEDKLKALEVENTKKKKVPTATLR